MTAEEQPRRAEILKRINLQDSDGVVDNERQDDVAEHLTSQWQARSYGRR